MKMSEIKMGGMKLFENPAGFWRRFGALILDGIVFMIIGLLFIGIDNKDTRDPIKDVQAF